LTEITLADVIAATYSDTDPGTRPPIPSPGRHNTVLLMIDIQGFVTPAHMARMAVCAGLPEDQVNAALADYRSHFDAALAVCSRLLQAARQYGVPPIHVKIEALSGDGRDMSPIYAMLGWSYPRDAEATAFLPEVAPLPGEIVLTKTVGSAFTGTILDRVLRNMGILHLYVCGFLTDECVESTLRDALDYGYLATVIGDATAAYRQRDHTHTISKFDGYGLAAVSDKVVEVLATTAGR
jgi:ureidoacrylate peracid hydrolase